MDEDVGKSVYSIILAELGRNRSDLSAIKVEQKAQIILQDIYVLARCAQSKCLITYGKAIDLRGHGNQQNGLWLDEVYANAVVPLGFPDLTMLVVNKATKKPSPEAFAARRSLLSNIEMDDVPAEQDRCWWYPSYEAVLGPLVAVPDEFHLYRSFKPEPAKAREISRAVSNAIARVNGEGVAQTKIGKAYPNSLSHADLSALVDKLWQLQKGCCALTGHQFDVRADDEGGRQDDRVSLDRIDNTNGYADGNVQLVTQFANRARGTLDSEEARRRLVQFS